MSKHSARQITPARLVLGFAAAILAALVGWVAVRSGSGTSTEAGDPVIVQPAPPPAELQAAEASLPPILESAPSVSVSVSPSVSRSGSPSASRSRSTSASPSASPSRQPRKSRSPSPSPTPSSRTSSSPAPVDDLDATYTTTASWRDGFIGAVRVVNNGSVARDFTVTITYPAGADLRVRNSWNGSAGGGGNQVTVRGASLAPGASITAGFQAGKDGGDSSRATGCTVGGGSCRVS